MIDEKVDSGTIPLLLLSMIAFGIDSSKIFKGRIPHLIVAFSPFFGTKRQLIT